MRLNRGTWVLLGSSVLIIFGILLFQEPLKMLIASPTPIPIVQTILPHDLAETATRLVIRQWTNQTQMERMDGIWQITDATAIDTTRETSHEYIDGILALMSTFEYSSAFETDDLRQFGLDDPQVWISVETNTARYTLYLGQTNPDGDRVYVKLNGEPTVYLLPTVFELGMIVKLATEPPYRERVPQVAEELSGSLLFPTVFGYQIAEFYIEDGRDGSFIRYTQGDLGTWILEGTMVDEKREVNHSQAAINVSQFLFLEVEPSNMQVRNSITDVAILRLSMTTDDSQTYNMNIFTVNDVGYVGIVDDGDTSKRYDLPTNTVNIFFDMIRQPPYAKSNG